MSRVSQPVLELLPAEACSVGPSAGLLEGPLVAQIVALEAAGLTLLQIAAAANVSTATVRVALGRVTPRGEKPAQAIALVQDGVVATVDHDHDEDPDEDRDIALAGELVVLAAPVPR